MEASAAAAAAGGMQKDVMGLALGAAKATTLLAGEPCVFVSATSGSTDMVCRAVERPPPLSVN